MSERPASSRVRACTLALALVLVLGAGLAGGVSGAAADGDPGSDVLVYQPLFLASDAGVSVAEQVRLGNLLQAAGHAGFPIRVAIIATRADLGAITELWQKPRPYARFLGMELSLAYSGRLLVVMPDGLGLNWPGHSAKSADQRLNRIPTGASGPDLVAAAEAAVRALAAGANVSLPPARASAPAGQPGYAPTAPRASSTSRVLVFVGLGGLAGLVFVLRLCWARRRRLLATLRRVRRRSWMPALVRRSPAAGALVLLAGALLTFVVVERPGPAASTALASNPVLDPGTPLSRPAPGFTLYDQYGRPTSLSAFRGKVVILAFNDSECTTLCPLTTTAMLDAKAMLGRAGGRVQLLGVDANPKATAIEDVASYSQLHGMAHAWDFLTGPLPDLERVWKSYSVGVQIDQRLVDHTPAIFIIDPQGRLARLYVAQQSYAAVPQLGQLLATEASRVLPGHPPVNSHLSYERIPGITPADTATLPRAGGGTLTLSPGRPRLLLFFATWDRQITGLAGGLQRLGGYQQLALHAGLPPLSAIDEGAVEPPGALRAFLGSMSDSLPYPVAIDATGRLADGFEVQGQPWLMLTTADGRIAWYQSVAALGWPSTAYLASQVKAALGRVPASAPPGSPASAPGPLAALHQQAARLLGSGRALAARIRALRGYPIVLNVWASWCGPCQAEFSLFAAASARYGHQVAFLGANYQDSPSDARAFLLQHPVGYPSYSTSNGDLAGFGAIEGLPTTIYLNRTGKVAFAHTGQYDTQGALDGDIQTYALGS